MGGNMLPLVEEVLGKGFENMSGLGHHMLDLYRQREEGAFAKVLENDLFVHDSLTGLIFVAEAGPNSIMPYQAIMSKIGAGSIVEVLSQGANYAEGWFEGMKIVRGSNGALYIAHPDDNWDRMRQGAASNMCPFDYSNEKLTYLSLATAIMQGYASSWPKVKKKDGTLADASILYVRPLYIRALNTGIGVGGDHQFTLVIAVIPMTTYFDSTKADSGVNIYGHFSNITPAFANSEESSKHLSNYPYAGRLRRGAAGIPDTAETVVILKDSGMVKEGSSDTVAIIKGDKIICPPLSTGRLNAITIRLVEAIAGQLGFSVVYEDVKVPNLIGCDGVLLFGNAVNLLGVQKVYLPESELKGVEVSKAHRSCTYDVFGRPTLLREYEFGTLQTEIFNKLKKAFSNVYTENPFGKYSVSTEDIFDAKHIGHLEHIGNMLKACQSPLVSMNIAPGMARDGALLTLDRRFYPTVGARRPDTSWSSGLQKRPVAQKILA